MRRDSGSPAGADPPEIPATPGRSESRSSGSRDGLLRAEAVLAFLAALAAYLNTLSNGFVYDDIPQVVKNPWIRNPAFLADAFTSNVWTFQGVSTNYYRPLMHAIYTACYQVFGAAPAGFHAVSVLLHGGTCVLVYLLLRRLVGNPAPGTALAFPSPPLIGALLFAVHPIHTEAVAWVSAVPELSFSFFALLSILLHLGFRRPQGGLRAFPVLSATCFFLAALCKETALVTPALLLAVDLAGRGPGAWREGSVRRYAPHLVAGAVYFALRFRALGGVVPLRRHEDLTLAQIGINALALFAAYLGKLLVPVRLSAYHAFELSTSVTTREGLLSLAVLAGTLCLAVVAWRVNRPAFLGILFVAIPLLPVLYVPALGENAFAERYLYFPSFGLFLCVAALLSRPGTTSGTRVSAVGFLALTVTGVCLAATIRRNAVWKDDLRLWTDVVAKSSGGAVPHYNLGCYLQAAGRIDEAIEQFKSAIRVQPAPVAYKSLGSAYEARGMPDEAISQYRLALEMEPRDADAHYRLGMAALAVGRREEAIRHLEQAVNLDPASEVFREGLRGALSGMPLSPPPR